jgi:hypothetical protein
MFMAELGKEVVDLFNQPGRIGTLATADKHGQPNAAYFGSLRPMADGSISVGLTNNRTLRNLQENALAVFFIVKEGPVTFQTPGYRLYLKVRGIHREGPVLDEIKGFISKHAGPEAASSIAAGVAFDVTEVRPLVAMG